MKAQVSASTRVFDQYRQISFCMLHVFEFKQGRISCENVWLD